MEQEPKLDPSTITDVETGKLALRWAVEKIHTLQEETGRLREDNRNKTNLTRSLTEQMEQKTEILKKWQGTIRTWEENWKTQTALETDLKAKLREQIINEETANWKQLRAQLEKEILALKNELAAREAAIGAMKLHLIDELKKTGELKEAELNTLLTRHMDNLAVKENSLREKYDRLEAELIQTLRLRTEQEELSQRERYETKLREFTKLQEQKEAQLEKFRGELDAERLERLGTLQEENRLALEEARRALAETFSKKKAEAAAAMEKDFALRLENAEEEKRSEVEAFKTANARELEALRGRVRDYMAQREQEHVDLRLEMEDQLAVLVTTREEETRRRYEKAMDEARAKWDRAAAESRAQADAAALKAAARLDEEFKERAAALEAVSKIEATAFKNALETEARARENTLRNDMLEEQNAWITRQQTAMDAARLALENAQTRRLEGLRAGLEEAYLAKEAALDEGVNKAQVRMKAQWVAREEEWQQERENALQAEKEKLKMEFEGHRALLHKKLSQFEDELKLKHSRKEAELEAASRTQLAREAEEFKKDLEAEKARLAEQAAAGRKELEAKAASLQVEHEVAVKSVDKKLRRAEEDLREKYHAKLKASEETFEERLETESKRLVAEFSGRAAAAEQERLKILEEKSALEAAHTARVRELEASMDDRAALERVKAEDTFKTRELHLQGREAELEKTKTGLEQQHSELKLKLYRELQGKEHELFGKLAAAKEEMYQALNTHREVLDREYDERLNGLRDKETALGIRFEEKLKGALEGMQQRQKDEAEKLALDLESRQLDLEARIKNREQALNASLSDRQARLEMDFLSREKTALAALEKAFEKRRQELETALARKEKELEKKYQGFSERFSADIHRERSTWETKKLEVLNAERQALRADFEKKEALLTQRLDEELAKNRADRVRREEEFSARKDELEKTYYAELERSRAALDKLRTELAAEVGAKFIELEQERNRLAALKAENKHE